MTDQQKSKVGLVFIEVLFAIVVGTGLERAINEPWIDDVTYNLLTTDFWFFTLGNTVVIASWIGYHKAMDTGFESEIRTWQEFLRFLVDLILLFLYARLLTSLDNPPRVFELIFWVFVFYVIWDCIAITEQSLEKHAGATIFWCAFMGVISLIASKEPRPLIAETLRWHLLCFSCWLGSLAYRLDNQPTCLDLCYGFLGRQQESLVRFLCKTINTGYRGE